MGSHTMKWFQFEDNMMDSHAKKWSWLEVDIDLLHMKWEFQNKIQRACNEIKGLMICIV